MICSICGKDIPIARLKVMPSATKCVPCLEAEGDVPIITNGSDNHRNYFNIPDSVYEMIPGDDSFVDRPEAVQHISAYHLSTAFESDVE